MHYQNSSLRLSVTVLTGLLPLSVLAQNDGEEPPVTILPDFTVLGEALGDAQEEPVSTSFLSEEQFERLKALGYVGVE